MTRKCPHCGEEIREEAIFCRFCRRDIEQPIWMSTLQKCPYCAEWIEIGLEDCPLCGKRFGDSQEPDFFSSIESEISDIGLPDAPSPSKPAIPEPKDPDALIASLRREAHPEDAPPEKPTSEEILPAELPEVSQPEPADDEWAQSVESSPIHSIFEPPSSRLPGFRKRRLDSEASGLRPISELVSDENEIASEESRIKSVPPFVRGIISLLIVIGLAVGVIVLIVGPGKTIIGALLTPEPTPTETVASTPEPLYAATLPPLVSNTPTSDIGATYGDCVRWDQVTISDLGTTMCVYGDMKRWWRESSELPFVAIFTEEMGSFAFYDYESEHNIKNGTCIIATGEIERRFGRLFINVTDSLDFCPEELE